MATGWIGISLGDVTGVGPEITLKALARIPADQHRFLILGDIARLSQARDQLGISLDFQPFENYQSQGRVWVLNPNPEPIPAVLPQGSEIAARAAIAWLRDGAQRCLRRELDALITAPLNKAAVIGAGLRFVGQTEFLSELAGASKTAMMLLGTDDRNRWLRVALATTHVPIRQVADRLSQDRIEQVIERTAQACALLRLKRARVGVCGLNPHAGEEGHMGTEDRDLIAPAVEAMRRQGFDVIGPLAADTLFHQALRGDFEAVVAMYHDQGLAPLKMIAFDRGVNWTLGLPFIRTSPDHGTAYDIAGRGLANPSSMIAALDLAMGLAKDQESVS
jgi:4-hydroxythreonine-4-phosphate dehydrogenase